jgi:glycine/D-amino acid oxidase-like deaminating enzyme
LPRAERGGRGGRWALDEASPFETVRVLDPYPLANVNDRTLSDLKRAFAAFAKTRVVQQWAGMIDVRPDAVSRASSLPPGSPVMVSASAPRRVVWRPI